MFRTIRVLALACILVLAVSSMTLAGLSMPKTLEAEFTQYPNSSVYQDKSSEKVTQVILDCGKASMETVSKYYKESSAKRGWSISREVKSGDLHQMWLAKGKQRGMIAISIEDGRTFVVLALFSK